MGADVAFQVPAGVDPPLVARTLGKRPKFRALPGEVRVWWLSFVALCCGWGAGESAAQLGPGVGGDGSAGAPRRAPVEQRDLRSLTRALERRCGQRRLSATRAGSN